MRQVAADAVLAELARMDFLHTEFSRTLEDLTHQFRTQHVDDIRAFRETIVLLEAYETPTWLAIIAGFGLAGLCIVFALSRFESSARILKTHE